MWILIPVFSPHTGINKKQMIIEDTGENANMNIIDKRAGVTYMMKFGEVRIIE